MKLASRGDGLTTNASFKNLLKTSPRRRRAHRCVLFVFRPKVQWERQVGMRGWQNSTERLLSLYVNSPELMDTKGVMTWSVGHDWSNNWKWVRTIKKIWGHGKS